MKTHNYLWHAFGMNGKILNWWPAEKSKFSAPEVELDISDIQSPLFEKKLVWSSANADCNLEKEEYITNFILEIYQAWGKFGPYGDLLQIHYDPDNHQAHVDFIGRLAWPKPALAADLIPIIRDAKGNLFFVGITRKKEPGIGKPALIGGHLDIKGFHLETAAEALIHEARDEAGIKIKVNMKSKHDYKNKPFLPWIPIIVSLKHLPSLRSELLLVGTFETSDEENQPQLKTKRVFQTTAYTMIIDIRNRTLTPKDVTMLFSAGDDAATIYVKQITSLKSLPFAINHHRTIYKATLAKLLREDRINI
ncbi:MAG: hypothetical protein NTX82_05090 [Candidatus Parcubacteria bacterium]|nr:hypothetical protein [Candidatus Parcubacteria bacterium]